MNTLIIALISAVLSLMQNPAVPAETKIQVYNQALPVITKYMDENKPVGEMGEIGTATSTENPSVGSPEAQPEEVKPEVEAKPQPTYKVPGPQPVSP